MGKQTQSKEKNNIWQAQQTIANPRATNSLKKKKKNLKTDGSKPNPRMVAKTEIRNRETELIASASNSSNRAHRHRSSPVRSEIGHRLGLASRIEDRNSTYWIGDSSPTALPLSLSLLTPSTVRYFIFTLHFSSL